MSKASLIQHKPAMRASPDRVESRSPLMPSHLPAAGETIGGLNEVASLKLGAPALWTISAKVSVQSLLASWAGQRRSRECRAESDNPKDDRRNQESPTHCRGPKEEKE